MDCNTGGLEVTSGNPRSIGTILADNTNSATGTTDAAVIFARMPDTRAFSSADPRGRWNYKLKGSSGNVGGICMDNSGFLRMCNATQVAGANMAFLDSLGNWASTSDQRIKTNIVDIDSSSAYDNMDSIRAVHYCLGGGDCIECNSTEENKGLKQNCKVKADTPHQIGFIAQDFKNVDGGVYASVVNKLGPPSDEDKEKFDFTGDEEIYGITYAKTTPIIMAALKGAKEHIKALEATVASLDARLKALESGK